MCQECSVCAQKIGKFERTVRIDGLSFHWGCSFRYERAKEEQANRPAILRRYYLPKDYGFIKK